MHLGKPGPSDYADIAVLNANMDALDKAVSILDTDKADKDLGNVDGAALKAAVAAAGAMTEVVDGLTETVPGKALDATQGKVLKKAIDDEAAARAAHAGDTVKHITAAERSSWNSKAAGSHTHTAAQVGADASGTATNAVSAHNGDATAHPSIVQAIKTWAQGAFAALAHKHSAADITSGTLPVARGGIGVNTVAAGSYLVGNGTGAITIKTPDAVRQHIGAPKHYSYHVTVPTTGWTAASVGWYKDITVSGVTAAMEPSGGVIKSDDVAAAELQQEAWDCINRITTGAGKIRVYCYHELPKVQITIQLVGTVP